MGPIFFWFDLCQMRQFLKGEQLHIYLYKYLSTVNQIYWKKWRTYYKYESIHR